MCALGQSNVRDGGVPAAAGCLFQILDLHILLAAASPLMVLQVNSLVFCFLLFVVCILCWGKTHLCSPINMFD
jgi:hypothetical protein